MVMLSLKVDVEALALPMILEAETIDVERHMDEVLQITQRR